MAKLRVTKEDLKNAWARFLRNIGGVSGTGEGQYWLDFNSAYGGYKVERYLAGGGATEPFGTTRRSITEMTYTLWFACQVLEDPKVRGNITLYIANGDLSNGEPKEDHANS